MDFVDIQNLYIEQLSSYKILNMNPNTTSWFHYDIKHTDGLYTLLTCVLVQPYSKNMSYSTGEISNNSGANMSRAFPSLISHIELFLYFVRNVSNIVAPSSNDILHTYKYPG